MNRWLWRTRYSPVSGGGQTDDLSNSATGPQPSPGERAVTPPSRSLSTSSGGSKVNRLLRAALPWLKAGAQLAAIVGTVSMVLKLSSLAPTLYVSDDHAARHLPTSSIRVERAGDEEAAQKLVNDLAPGARKLAAEWKPGGRSRFRIGTRPGWAPKYYIPTPRRGLESAFDDLQHDGLADLKIYDVLVPGSWPRDILQLFKEHWGRSCSVAHQSIDNWSSFLDPNTNILRNECVPGGTCVVVTFNCDADAFDDINSTFKFER
jgi:hypothetical protein